MELIFEKGKKSRKGFSFKEEKFDYKLEELIPEDALDLEKDYLEISEPEVVRHFVNLNELNYSVDKGFYPLGSCTMKYNPKINEALSLNQKMALSHPFDKEENNQGTLKFMYELENFLKEITKMDRFTLAPSAGAHGEFTGMLIIRKYFKEKGEARKKVLIPDSAHGTNPASAAMANFEVVEVKSDERGGVSIKELERLMDENVAALMLTNPNTVGFFDENIQKIQEIVHKKGGLLYYDGANLNALLGIVRPGDMGFDVIHLNLHKTFSTPHGGGGPGSGVVGVKEFLAPYLPVPIVEKKENKDEYFLNYDLSLSIGKVNGFYGNVQVLAKAYLYILSVGRENLRLISEAAILNANYILKRLKNYYPPAYDRTCMHEVVLSTKQYQNYGISLLDVAKRLMDYGFHPPTIYFPHFPPYAEEVMMIEPTETENLETIDKFIDALISIAKEIEANPQILKEAPHNTLFKRIDATKAAREPIVRYQKNKEK